MSKSKEGRAVHVSPPEEQRGTLKQIGGSVSDTLNNILVNQALRSLWLAHSDEAGRNAQYQAAITALIGVKPADEIEGMLGGQLVATHNAAMECYRRSMIENQTFEDRREALNQANKLAQSFATLLEALTRHRGKGQL